MPDPFDDLSPRASWFMENFDTFGLAEICASSEAWVKQLEDVIARVRTLHVPSRRQVSRGVPGCAGCEGDDPWTTPGYPCPTIAALEPPKEQPDGHVYLSTGCLHNEHTWCQSDTGSNGAKVPATCKFCATPCVCDCHSA